MTKLWPQMRTLRSRLTVALVVAVLCGAVAAGALAQGAGKSLIGKLEGHELGARCIVALAREQPFALEPERFPHRKRRRYLLALVGELSVSVEDIEMRRRIEQHLVLVLPM